MELNAAQPPVPLQASPRFRRPNALALRDGLLAVANQNSGTVSIVAVRPGIVKAEYPMGTELVDLATAGAAGNRLLVLCRRPPQLVLADWDRKGRVRPVARLPLPSDPARLARHDGRIAVTCRFSHQVVLLRQTADRLIEPRHVELPFPPGEVLFDATGEQLVAAHAFGGRMALLNWHSARVDAVRSFEGHHIGGLALDHQQRTLLLTHQVLQPNVRTLPERIFWGTLMGNFLRGISWDELDSLPRGHGDSSSGPHGGGVPIAHWYQIPLGEAGHGAGDPSAIVVGKGGRTAICLSGVDEVVLRRDATSPFRRVAVGRCPVDLALSPDGQTLFVANRFDDSISVVSTASNRVLRTMALGSMPRPGPVQRGESLFYDARLSHDGWFSCHSCHVDGHTCGRLNDNLGDGSYGAPKLIPTLLGVGDTPPWSWLGRRPSLVDQCLRSIATTMRGSAEAATRQHAADLAAYLRTLPPAPGLPHHKPHGEATAAERSGARLFARSGCADCHPPPTYSSAESYDMGRADAVGNRRFNPPSLRGIGQRERFWHDGRARTLTDAMRQHERVLARPLSIEQHKQLAEWLRTK